MVAIDKIVCRLDTGTEKNASTDGDVYLGICGREFYLDTDIDDFQGGAQDFILGVAANVKNASYNDPRKHWKRYTADLEKNPVYIRFEPLTRERDGPNLSDGVDWLLTYALVTVNPGPGEWEFEALKDEDEELWFSQLYGKVCYLKLKTKGKE